MDFALRSNRSRCNFTQPPVNRILKRASTIRARTSPRFHKLRNPQRAPHKSIGLLGENCRGRLCFRIHGNGDDRALPHRARDPVGPAPVAARPVRVSFRADPAAILQGRPAPSESAPDTPTRLPSGRPPSGRKKAVLRLKCRAQIPPNTLDISALSAERLSDASWIVHGSDYHHFRPRRRLLPARPAQGHHRRHRVPAGDDLLSPALRRADGERGRGRRDRHAGRPASTSSRSSN